MFVYNGHCLAIGVGIQVNNLFYYTTSTRVVQGANAEQKLQWLKVQLTGRTQKAFQRLPEATQATFDATKAALTGRFEPASRKTRYIPG